jgi:hypothetical protein
VLYQLSYAHHIEKTMARLRGLEPLTYGLEVRCSILLSYRRRCQPAAIIRQSLAAGRDLPQSAAFPCARSLNVHRVRVARSRCGNSASHNTSGPSLRRLANSDGSGCMVGARGFEPPTPCAQGRCATRLRYTPTNWESTHTLQRTTTRRWEVSIGFAGRKCQCQGQLNLEFGILNRASPVSSGSASPGSGSSWWRALKDPPTAL